MGELDRFPAPVSHGEDVAHRVVVQALDAAVGRRVRQHVSPGIVVVPGDVAVGVGEGGRPTKRPAVDETYRIPKRVNGTEQMSLAVVGVALNVTFRVRD